MKLRKSVAKNILALIKVSATTFISFMVVHFLFGELYNIAQEIVISIIFGLVLFYYIFCKIKWFEEDSKPKKVAKPSYMYYNSPTDKELKKREEIVDKLVKEKEKCKEHMKKY